MISYNKYNFARDWARLITKSFSFALFLNAFYSTYKMHDASLVFRAFLYTRFV